MNIQVGDQEFSFGTLHEPLIVAEFDLDHNQYLFTSFNVMSWDGQRDFTSHLNKDELNRMRNLFIEKFWEDKAELLQTRSLDD